MIDRTTDDEASHQTPMQYLTTTRRLITPHPDLILSSKTIPKSFQTKQT